MLFKVLGAKVARGVERNGDPAAVEVVIDVVGAGAAIECEPVTNKRRDYFAGGQVMQVCIIHTQGSDGDRYPRLDCYLNVVRAFLREALTVLGHAVHHKLDHFVDVLQGFLAAAAPCGSSTVLQGRAVCVPAIVIRLHYDFETVGLHSGVFSV